MRITRSVRRLIVALLLVGLLLPAPCLGDEPGDTATIEEPEEAPAPADDSGVDWDEVGRRVGYGAAVGLDVVIVRPIYVCATIIGAALFVPVFIMSAAGGSEARNEAYDLFIEVPSQGIYSRPLGQF